MHSLPIFVDVKGKPVILVGEGEMAAAKRRLIERAGAVPVGRDDPDARIGFVAFPDDARSTDAAARLKARGLLVNVADRPELCDFTSPAIVDRDPVLVAVSSGGRSAGLAKALRQRLEAILPADLGALAEALFAARDAMRARWSDPHRRRQAIDAGLAEGGPLDPLRGGSAAGVGQWATEGDAGETSRLIAIRLRSGDPDDLTLGEARLLGQAERIFHRPEVPPAILARARADAARTACDAPPSSPGQGLSIDLGFA